jgi:hypothetical protein
MNEQCAGCPWLDEPKKQCRRTPPRFCSIDDSDNKPAVKKIPTPAEEKPQLRSPDRLVA